MSHHPMSLRAASVVPGRCLFALPILVSLLPWGCSSREEPEPTQPNILFAIADDWGFPHAGTYGDPVVKTPTFDRLAREGIVFNQAYISSPSCTPSRAAVLTGQWHWRLEESANLWSTLQTKFPVYPDLLEEAGYFVGHTGKAWGPGRLEPGGRTRNPAGPEFSSFAEFLDSRPAERPFCFWFGTYDPHRPYEPGSGKAAGMDLDAIRLPACLPDSPEVRSDVADYYFEVQRFDTHVGELLEELEKRNELDNTIIIMTGDHGMPFPRAKGNLYDIGTRVPLVIRWPELVASGRHSDDFVSLTDLAPTILELTGVRVPGAITGKSLRPILSSKESGLIDSERTHVLTGKERHVPVQETPDGGGTPMRSIRTRDFLYIYNFRPDRWPAGTPHYEKAFIPGTWYGDVDNGPTKFYMVDHRNKDDLHRKLFDLAFAKRPAEELYDLKKDPNQLTNVAADPEYLSIKGRLSEQLMKELSSTLDPRVHGMGDLFDSHPYYGHGPRARGWKEQ